jgi:prepilin-type N-terminal cleavage/methylation domain-containing protein
MHRRRGFTMIELLVVIGIIGVLVGLLLPAVHGVREAAARSHCGISQLAFAIHRYQDVEGKLPPGIVYGEDGQALYSWRVPILPFIEGEALYRQFNLSEPWTSPQNYALLAQMPRNYAPPTGKEHLVPANHTVCRVFVGPGTAFESYDAVKLDDFADGTSATFFFVEAGPPTPWSKPGDIPYDSEGPLPHLPGLFRAGFRSQMADGSRRFVKSGTDAAIVRAAITRNGGESMPQDW